MYLLQEKIQIQQRIKTTFEDSYWGKTIWMPNLQQKIQPERSNENAFEHCFIRADIKLIRFKQ